MRGIFGVIVFILMALPLAWFYVAMYWGFTITKDIAAFQSGETLELPIMPPVKWLEGRRQVKDAFSPDEITRGRSVSYSIEVPFADMLQDGEAMPDRALAELYATLRTPAYFMPICDEILGTLAEACELGSFKADVRYPEDRRHWSTTMEHPETGLAILTASLNYLPAYPMGNPGIVPNGEIEAARVELFDGKQVPNTVEGRAEIYAEALALCTAMREAFGNCSLRSVSMEPRRAKRDPDAEPHLTATVAFRVMVDKTKYRRAAVQAALDEIVATRLASTATGSDG
ncbi:MAG: hypothetical protein AAF718_02685 [Pseudomonadota bacterium]